MKYLLTAAILCLSFGRTPPATVKVNNEKELQVAIANAVAGTEIVMRNGIWKDIQIQFTGRGTAASPIVLRAETPGQVSIQGLSDLKLGGQYLEVRGLYFNNGHTPSKSVLAFRIDSSTIAKHCKIVDCAIKDFNQPNRSQKDHWIEFWGQHNTLDRCTISGKANSGPTLFVGLAGNEHANNHHQITNNHFGPRPRKGGPHGETIQVGDSYTSMVPSFTNIANNIFDRCDGEVEIISNKSNNNIYRNNIFYRSEGSLVLRHGNYCTVDGNRFIGDGKSKAMGGIRVINTGHWITNNYFYNIIGDEFRSALAVMNGVPKSPQNRYNQVTDVVVAYNTFVNCTAPWQFSVGANMDQKEVLPLQEIRSARPLRTIVANNLIYNKDPQATAITAYDVVDGVSFHNNISNTTYSGTVKEALKTEAFLMEQRSDWLFVPKALAFETFSGFDFETIQKDLFGNDRKVSNSIGAISAAVTADKNQINLQDFGATWFKTASATVAQNRTVANVQELVAALKALPSGSAINLKKGTYVLHEPLSIGTTISIASQNKKQPATLHFEGAANSSLFVLAAQGKLQLTNVTLEGTGLQHAFATKTQDMGTAYGLSLNGCTLRHFDFVLKAYKDSFADEIQIANSNISACKNGLGLASETADAGEYNVEILSITNCKFDQIENAVVDYYRGGYDESTVGGTFVFKGNSVTNSGTTAPNGLLLKTRGIVNVTIEKNVFANNPVRVIAVLWGEKKQEPKDNVVRDSGEFKTEQHLKQKMMY